MMSEIYESLENHGATIISIFTLIATVAAIGGAVLYVEHKFENKYAAAVSEVKQILQNQSNQIEIQQRNQKEQLMFRLEYYDDRIAKLLEEKRVVEERDRTKASKRVAQKIGEEIVELKQRQEMIKRSLINVDNKNE